MYLCTYAMCKIRRQKMKKEKGAREKRRKRRREFCLSVRRLSLLCPQESLFSLQDSVFFFLTLCLLSAAIADYFLVASQECNSVIVMHRSRFGVFVWFNFVLSLSIFFHELLGQANKASENCIFSTKEVKWGFFCHENSLCCGEKQNQEGDG